MSAFAAIALIVGIFFTVGIVVGFLAVMAIPALGRVRSSGGQPLTEFHPDSRDQPSPGPPAGGAQAGPAAWGEPDDRDDYPWWPNQR